MSPVILADSETWVDVHPKNSMAKFIPPQLKIELLRALQTLDAVNERITEYVSSHKHAGR